MKFIERVRDSADRRKILIRVRPESLEGLIPQYEEIGRAYAELAAAYSDDALQAHLRLHGTGCGDRTA